MDDVAQFFRNVGSIALYTLVAVVVALVVFEVLNRRFHLMREIFEENSVAAGVFGGAFVLGIFYTVAQIVAS
ncbi:MAG: hypothetical protein C4290_09380 [Chloroflexota bacterium]